MVHPKVRTKDDVERFGLKLLKQEREVLTARAKRFANGNLSAWLRYAGMHYKPAKSVIIR